jgi:hypothetical protein
VNFALFATLTEQSTAIAAALASIASFSKNAAWADSSAVTASTLAVWRAPFACTVTALRGYRVGGSGATINAYRNTTGSPHRSSALSVTSTSTWISETSPTNTAYAAGDTLLLALLSVTGVVTQAAVQVDFTRS